MKTAQRIYDDGGFAGLRKAGYRLYRAKLDVKGIAEFDVQPGGIAWAGRSATDAELKPASHVAILSPDGAQQFILDRASGIIARAVVRGGPPPREPKPSKERKAHQTPPKPSLPSETAARRNLVEAIAIHRTADTEAKKAAENVARLRAGMAEAEAEAERWKQRAAQTVAETLAAGDELPDLSKDRAKMRAAEERRAGFADALPLAKAGETEAASKLAIAREALENATFDYDAALAAKALVALRASGEAFLAPLAALAALDTMRGRLLGDRPTLDPTRHAPIGGVNIAKHIIEALPETVRPDVLNIENIEARAADIAAAIFAELKESEQ